MAEVLGIIGSVAAVSQLASQFVALTTSLRRALKVIRHAPEEIQSFLMDTSNFTSLLNFFAELADRAMKKAQGKERHRRERMIAGIRKQCRSVCDKIADLVGHFAALARGGMTPLEGFIERIRYLLDKPDVKDLRLSVQLAATIVNGMSTLFMWEALAKTDEQRSTLYLEQLRNQLPVAREASAQLAKHQQRHGFAYESGGPDDVMLVVSKEMLRQIDRVIKPHIRPEDTGHQSPKRRRRERRRDSSVVDETDSVRRRPSSSDGLPSPSTDAASRVSEPRSGTTSPDMDVST
ncbi:hypothetical protein F5B18DRAFT_353788 [Nemania serpens]|nr:hypothetical protein F5B18DRAFT_353788 [Nemania serpens]